MFTRILAGLAGIALVTSLLAAEPIRPPDLNATQVTLPYSELKALWQAANRAASAKRKPPVEAALLSARYQLTLRGDIAAGAGTNRIRNCPRTSSGAADRKSAPRRNRAGGGGKCNCQDPDCFRWRAAD